MTPAVAAPHLVDLALRLYEDGKPVTEIAKTVGLTEVTIQKYRRLRGIASHTGRMKDDGYFWALVRQGTPDECWPWTGRISPGGYGVLSGGVEGRYTEGAHRNAFIRAGGVIPPGMHLDHLCRNPPCCNPAHLEPVPIRENTLRGVGPAAINARKTHCIHGHAFTSENTRVLTNGTRVCRACVRERQRRYRLEAKKK